MANLCGCARESSGEAANVYGMYKGLVNSVRRKKGGGVRNEQQGAEQGAGPSPERRPTASTCTAPPRVRIIGLESILVRSNVAAWAMCRDPGLRRSRQTAGFRWV